MNNNIYNAWNTFEEHCVQDKRGHPLLFILGFQCVLPWLPHNFTQAVFFAIDQEIIAILLWHIISKTTRLKCVQVIQHMVNQGRRIAGKRDQLQ